LLLATNTGLHVIREPLLKKDKKIITLFGEQPVTSVQARFDSGLIFASFGEGDKICWFPLALVTEKSIPATSLQKIDGTKRTVAFRVAGKASQLFMCCIKDDKEEQAKGKSKGKGISLSELKQRDKGALAPHLLHELNGLQGDTFSIRLDLFPDACVVSDKGIFLLNFMGSSLSRQCFSSSSSPPWAFSCCCSTLFGMATQFS